jgi:hypothetical protein
MWFWKEKETLVEVESDLQKQVRDIKHRIEELRKVVDRKETHGNVQETQQKDLESVGFGKEEKGNEVRLETSPQDVEKEKRSKDLNDLKAKLMGRK